MNKPEISAVVFVLVGDFNPKIFHPSWFAANGLIPLKETEPDQIEKLVVHEDITNFKLPWATFQVTPKNFIASTEQESHFELLRDLVLGTFTLLKHTPIYQMGINVVQHFKVEERSSYNAFGDLLAPKQPWEGIMKQPKLMKMIMVDELPVSESIGRVQVTIEPSPRVKPGILFSVNDHYECSGKDAVRNAERMSEILNVGYAGSYERSNNIIQGLVKKI